MGIRILDQTAASSSSNALKPPAALHLTPLRSIRFGWNVRIAILTTLKNVKQRRRSRRARVAKPLARRDWLRDADRQRTVRHEKSRWTGMVSNGGRDKSRGCLFRFLTTPSLLIAAR